MDYPKSKPEVGLVGGKFNDGDPLQGIPASLDPASHMNAITDELLAVITGFGLVPDETKSDQLYKAIAGRIGSAGGFSFRNLLIDATGTINQAGYVSGAATSGANKYALDMWRVVVSGQNLSWVASGAINVMTAPAGGVEQVIGGSSILGGTYTLNWTGTATATVNGIAVLKGGTFALSANANATVRFTGGTFSMPQLEMGTVPTSFELLDPSIGLVRSQQYFEKVGVYTRVDTQNGNAPCIFGTLAKCSVTKKSLPACTYVDVGSIGLGTAATVASSDFYGAVVTAIQTASGVNTPHTIVGHVFFDSRF
ncbi:hypothetical protein [uncultured Deefgea sp.]|uniref:hypothetical protein n=1 Tax=uncultured Deefgea sp. TaxID=1304914 RepID=UPI002594921B|nr:hypothetical protein [uncultured Deefgea sp.]